MSQQINNPIPDKDIQFNITINPANVYGLNQTTKMRIVVFEKSDEYHYIDFIRHSIQHDALYIIPPFHYHYLGDIKTNFICLDINCSLLPFAYKSFFYGINYQQEKCITFKKRENKSNYEMLTECFERSDEPQAQLNFFLLALSTMISLENKSPKSRLYIEHAEKLITLLSQNDILHSNSNIKDFASCMCVHERTLRRICINVFEMKVNDILKYHLMLKAIYHLLQSNMTIGEIANYLNFNSISSFNHFLKSMTSVSPSKIRNVLSENIVYVR